MPRIVTADMLHQAGACLTQIDRFRQMFPEGAEVTVENFDKFGRNHIRWFGGRVLRGLERSEFFARSSNPMEHTDPARSCPECLYDAKLIVELWGRGEET